MVNALREKDGLLCSRASMNRFCCQHPEAEFEGNYCTEYGFKVQTSQHTYMLRCNLNYGDYNFYLYAYVARFLEHHIEKAQGPAPSPPFIPRPLSSGESTRLSPRWASSRAIS